jgi:tetratricopeptide (TPR) repeat protein
MAPSAVSAPSASAPRESAQSGGELAVRLESWDPRLAAAHGQLLMGPTPERHRRVAVEYHRLGVLDQAFEHYSSAARLDSADAAAYDGLARIWRDSGFPSLGLRDALKAVELAPASPEAANTLATLYLAMGQPDRAVEWYARAVTLNPAAWYALNNLCYVTVMLGRPGAVAACEQAVALHPASSTTRNNLALAYAAEGDLDQAQAAFTQSGPAAGHYNMGIVHMALGRYDQATAAFTAALAAQPYFPLAAARMRQSQALASGTHRHVDDH